MTRKSQISTTKPKKQKLSKQVEQQQNRSNGDHMEGYQWGGRGGEWGKKAQGIRNIVGRRQTGGS